MEEKRYYSDEALRIAEMYNKKFPRENHYRFDLIGSENERQTTYFFPLTEEEKVVLRYWQKAHEEEGNEWYDVDIWEYLQSFPQLVKKVTDVVHPNAPLEVEGFELDDPKRFTNFGVFYFDKEEKPCPKRSMPCILSEEELCKLIAMRLEDSFLSFNQLVYKWPEFAQRIMRNLTWNIYHQAIEYPYTFAVVMDEIEEIADKILNPEKDVLSLANSEDKALQKFWKLKNC